MKRIVTLLATGALLVMGTAAFAQTPAENYIEVHGSAEKTVQPDRISLSITVSENDYRKRSMATLEKEMKNALTDIGIDVKRSLKVDDITSSFASRRKSNPDAVLSKRYTLEVGSASLAAKAIQALDDADISNAYISKSEYSRMDSLKVAIKADAMKNALEIATTMTGAIGQKLGPAIYIYEQESYAENYRPVRVMAAKSVMMDSMEAAGVEEEVDLEFKEIKVNCRVTVRFSLPQ